MEVEGFLLERKILSNEMVFFSLMKMYFFTKITRLEKREITAKIIFFYIKHHTVLWREEE